MVEKRGMHEAAQRANGWEVISDREESGGSSHPEGQWYIAANRDEFKNLGMWISD